MASFDPAFFQTLEAVAAPFGLALVSCDGNKAAYGPLPRGGVVLFIPRSFNQEAQRQLVADQVLLIQQRGAA